jgi:DNA-directed RNA polymerase specialized sigma24 family protein
MTGEPLDATDTYTDWQDVYRDHVAGINRLIYRQVGNRSGAEDLTAEVFMATLKPLRLPARVHEIRGYLVATTRTVLASFWRRHYAGPPTVVATFQTAHDGPGLPFPTPTPRRLPTASISSTNTTQGAFLRAS